MGNKIKKYWEEKKPIIIIAAIILIILLIFSWVKIGLYISFLLGNDTLIKLRSDKEVLYLTSREEENIKFKASSIANPFCKVMCGFVFNDISNNKVIDKGEFILKSTDPLEKEYSIKITEKGDGQKLYQFKMECRSKSSLLCHTSEEITTRSNILVVNYNLSEEFKVMKDGLKNDLEALKQELDKLISKEKGIEKTIGELNKILIVDELEEKFHDINIWLDSDKENLFVLKEIWEKQDYDLLGEKIKELEKTIEEDGINLNELNNDLVNITSLYNSLIIKLMTVNDILNNTNNISEIEIENITLEFNNALIFFKEKNNIKDKEERVNEIYDKIKRVVPYSKESTIENIFGVNFINITEEDIKLNVSFDEPPPKCCVFGKCDNCCVGDECRDNTDLFPIIFLHGHAVSKEVSAEYSLEGFGKIENKLELDGYLNAGTITLDDFKGGQEGIFGLTKVPLMFRGSYYFDVLNEGGNYEVIQAKSESIDTYSIRLRELIDILKYKTGRDKVNIVAFSMGGLVTRRYLQIFGDEDVNKVILIGTPNKGIVGEVKGLCPIVGEKLECRDMDMDSLFINKLNRDSKYNVKIHNIIGTGCKMGQDMGDGIVLEKNALLERANNYIINGTCKSKIESLHLELRDINNYPVVYEIIIKVLKEN